MYFLNYRLWKTWLDNCLKSPLSEDPSTSNKKNLFLEFTLHFWNLYSIWNVLKQKIKVIADVFAKLRTQKTWLDNCLKKVFLEEPSRNNMVNGPKHFPNLNDSAFSIFIDHSKGLRWEKLLIVICKILRLFGNIFTANEKHSILYRENLMQPIHMQWFQKKKIFSRIFLYFWNLY